MNKTITTHMRHRLYALSCLLALAGSAQATPLTVGVTENDAAPSLVFLRTPQLQLTGGLWKDLLDEVGRRLGREVRYLPLARKRLGSYLQSGDIDLACNSNPAWWDEPRLFYWSLPLGEQIERFVTPAHTRQRITDLSQLNGMRIGTIIGYHYPRLDDAFANGAQRIDQQQGNLQLRAVATNVVDIAVIDELSYAWWQKHNSTEARQVTLQPLVLSRQPLSCALSRRSSLTLDSLNQVISAMDKQGTIKAIYRPYLPK